MKRLFKWLSFAFLGLLLITTSLAAHQWYAEKPFSFRVFLDRSLITFSIEKPEMLTSLGLFDAIGITGHNAKLDDASLAAKDKERAHIESIINTLALYDDNDLDEQEKLSKDIATYLLKQMNGDPQLRYHNYPINQLFGVQNNYPTFMQSKHQVNNEQDARYYLARLDAVTLKFEQVLEGLKLREKMKIIPPRFVIERVIDEMSAFTQTPANENILYTSFEGKLNQLNDMPEPLKSELLASANNKINESVYPAYTLLINYFTELKPSASEHVGYWHLPDGDKAYRQALEKYTTTKMSPDQLHQLGFSEVERIKAQMMTILAAEGYDTSRGFYQAMETLKADPKHYYEDSEKGRAQILTDYRAIVAEIDQGIAKAFNIRTDSTLEIERIPKFKEKTAPVGYYQTGSLDGSRPGRFSVNLYDIKATPKYGMRTLAYHESIPGHHFQLSIAKELEGLPMIRRMAAFSAHSEGWALYTEQLAWELGFQKEPLDNLGRLQAEIFRAVRLVVDTGIHAKRWTREQAIDYMIENTGMAHSDVVAEVERYIVMPGQACSYKVGMIKILALREKTKTALGERFSLPEFHDVMLKNGGLPLTMLEQIVDKYIAEKSA